MSALSTAMTFVRARIPEPLVFALRTYGLGRLPITPPPLQIYVCEHGISSFAGINNYFSTFAPEIETEALVELQLYDASGAPIGTHRLSLPHFGSTSLDIAALLRMRGLSSPRGILTVQMRPRRRRRPSYQRLGDLCSHFFMFYRDELGSVAQIHPSSILAATATPSPPFLSSHIITTRGLSAVVLYQCNPAPYAHEMTLSLLDPESRAPLIERRIALPPRGVERVELPMAAISRLPARLLLAASAFPSANSKPMLQRLYADGRFSMSHA